MKAGEPIYILIILLAYLGLTRLQSIGRPCNYSLDGRKGVCRVLRECLDHNGTSESARRTKLCSNPDLGTLVVCCRSSVPNIALNKCRQWQEERRKVSFGECIVTIPFIHNGEKAYAGEFPHMVSVLESNNNGLKHVCGGTLIAPNWVLTAAHCVVAPRLQVYLGAHNLQVVERDITLAVLVRTRILHPEYHPPPESYNDIALLQLAYKAPSITDRIQPACLPYSGRRVREGEKLVVAGWGVTPEGDRTSNILLKAEVRSLSRITCSTHPSYITNLPGGITDSILCMDEREQGSCKGDSGGPLMREFGGACTHMVVGVVSRGVHGCQRSTIPAIYTNVEYYLDWIVNNIWKEEEGL